MTDVAVLQWSIAAGAGSAMALTVAGVAQVSRATRRRVRGRLESLQDNSTYTSEAPQSVELLRDRSSKIPLPSWLTAGQSGERIQRMLEQAGLDLRVGEYLTLRVLATTLGLAVGLVLARTLGVDAFTAAVAMMFRTTLGVLLPTLFI